MCSDGNAQCRQEWTGIWAARPRRSQLRTLRRRPCWAARCSPVCRRTRWRRMTRASGLRRQRSAARQPRSRAGARTCRSRATSSARSRVVGRAAARAADDPQLHPAARRAGLHRRRRRPGAEGSRARPSCSPISRSRNDNGNVVITVEENPVINRIILEGNKRIKDDKIMPEIKLAPRQIFTRSKVRADVARIIELYKRQGRFAATVEPQDGAADAEPRRRRLRDHRRAQVQGPPDQHHRQRSVLRRRSARRDGDQARRGLFTLLQLATPATIPTAWRSTSRSCASST